MAKLIVFIGQGLDTLCAVPEEILDEAGGYDRARYVISGWASINCGENSNAIGSHCFPSKRRANDEDARLYLEKLASHGRYDPSA